MRKIAAAAAVALVVGTGSILLLKPNEEDAPGNAGQAFPSPDVAGEQATSPEDLAAKEASARELAESQRAAEEAAAKKAAEAAAAEKLAKQEEAAMERAAVEEARKKAMEEKALREKALVQESGRILDDPKSSSVEKEQAFSKILPLANDGDIRAIELCGASYWQGNGVTQDKEEARAWFEQGARLGNARSILGLGYCHQQGIGGPIDMAKAVELWVKAANLGYEVAMSRLGDYFYLNPEDKNISKAMEWWRKAAEAESPSTDAMRNLGIIHAKGIETGKDLVEAAKWLRMAADMGDPEAKTELGILYFNGDIQDKESEAFPLFLQAAEAGSLRAMYGLEACFRQGIGTEKDLTEAGKWARKAAEAENRIKR